MFSTFVFMILKHLLLKNFTIIFTSVVNLKIVFFFISVTKKENLCQNFLSKQRLFLNKAK